MKAFSSLLGLMVGLAILAGLAFGGYHLFLYVVDVFNTLKPHARTLAAIFSVVTLLSAMIVAGGLKARKGKPAASPQKEELYQETTRFIAGKLQATKSTAAEQKILEQKLALYAGQKVIEAYRHLRDSLNKDETKESTELLFTNLLMAMRSEIGRRDNNLKKSDLNDLLFTK